MTPQDTLRQILVTAGIDPVRASGVSIAGSDPELPTRFLMGISAAAALGAVGLAAADLWRLRGGEDQEINIDTVLGAAALRTSKYLRVADTEGDGGWEPISGFYQGADDRWIQLHCQFPHFREGVLALLECNNDREQVAKAISAWQTPELEDTLAARGLPAFMVRSNAEWEMHPQNMAVAQLPLLEIIKIGDAPPEPLPRSIKYGDRPLSGIRSLDLTRVIAGPVTGRTLAEHGAEVLRISGPQLPFIEPLVIDTGHGKRAAEVDLRTTAGIEQLHSLIQGADIFSQSYRPGSLAARGLSPSDLAAIRAGIVCVSLSAWSHVGPWADRRGFDSLVQCATGIADEHGKDGQPLHLPGQALDYLSGYLGAFGAMVALARRAREGGSWLVRLSLAQTAHWLKSLGRVEGTEDPRDRVDPGIDAVAGFMMQSNTAWGQVHHLGPVLKMSITPPHWTQIVRPLGTDEPTWLTHRN
jgi:crotonobetainyl-CoA:carnitine CoA-transferase CaiB-like acyl-CoA transferase